MKERLRGATSPFGDEAWAASGASAGAWARARAARSGSAGCSVDCGSSSLTIGEAAGATGSSRWIGATVAGSGQADSTGSGSGAGSGACAGSGHPASTGSGAGCSTGSGARTGSGHPASAGSGSPWGAACAAASSKGGGSETQPPGWDGCAAWPGCEACADGPVVAGPPEACPTCADTLTVRPVTSLMAFSTSAARGPREKALTMASTGKRRTTREPSTAPS